jgi:hypothetical protein
MRGKTRKSNNNNRGGAEGLSFAESSSAILTHYVKLRIEIYFWK